MLRPARAMHHARRDRLIQRGMRLGVWDLSANNEVKVVRPSRHAVRCQDHEDLAMRQAALLKLNNMNGCNGLAEHATLKEVILNL